MTADEVRQAMSADPAFLEFANALRDAFAAKLVWMKVGEVEIGRRPAYLEPLLVRTHEPA
jgi:hypothetical protein